jgi:ubiquinol-cytochrome c reductase iron-sulfur subunit
VATGAAVWPLVNQMNPSADVRALASIRVDISGVAEGSQLTVQWLGKPVFIRHRTQEEIDSANATDVSELPDQNARNANIAADADASDANRTLDEDEKWLVMMGVCTHLGCVPIGNQSGDYDGWYCPCHGSHYDAAAGLRPRTFRFRSRSSLTNPPFSWAKGETNGWYPPRPLRAEVRL